MLRGRDTSTGSAGYCPACKKWCERGPDPCLGEIPGVSHACCGHGGLAVPYVVIGGLPNQGVPTIESAVVLEREAALAFFELIANGEHLRYGETMRPAGIHEASARNPAFAGTSYVRMHEHSRSGGEPAGDQKCR